jgi:peroxisomal 2,4-dienoyl-CoA reductase
VDALTRGLAAEWREHGIRVVGIAPGPVAETEGMRRLKPTGAEPVSSDYYVEVEKIDIGLAAVFLASSAARGISGDTLVVDRAMWLTTRPMVPREFYNTNIRPHLPKPKL